MTREESHGDQAGPGLPTLDALIESRDAREIRGDDRVRCPVCAGKAEARLHCRFCGETGSVSVIGLACEGENRVREGPCEDYEKACDECGEAIPVVEGGSTSNRHHAESCSLYDEDED